MLQALEAYGYIDSTGLLKINTPTPIREGDVKVIIMYRENEELDEEQVWVKSVSKNPAFEFLNDREEDIYTLNDGKALDD
jgi:hypothetical protein